MASPFPFFATDTATSGLNMLGLPLIFATVLLGFATLLWGLRGLFKIEWAPLSVARTVLDEAIRMKVAVVFIGMLFLLLSALPFLIDPETPLRYRVQFFLSYSLGATSFLLSLMTIFLACGTLAFEIEDQRIFTTMVKPIHRGAYLLGKWLGLAGLNLVLLGVAGLAIYGATTYLSTLKAKDSNDQGAIQEEILTARVTARPQPARSLEERVDQQLDMLRRENPGQIEELGLTETRRQLLGQETRRWRHIPPNGRETYVFTNLAAAKHYGHYVQLRYKARPAKTPPGGKLNLGLILNGHGLVMPVQVSAFQVLPVRAEWIDDDGRLVLTVINADPRKPEQKAPTGISFLGEDELEVLYQVDTFGMNILRGLLLLWLKLGFLAILGLCASTFLSFPVACLAGVVIFIMASTSGFMIEALTSYSEHEAREQWGWATAPMRGLATLLVRILSPFSRMDIGEKLTDGRLISWSAVLSGVAWIGLVWSGLTGLLAWRIFQSRELGKGQT